MNQFKLWVVIITLSVTVGSSFIAIKIVLDSISPLFAFSIRFMITGGVLILGSYVLDRKNQEIKKLKLWRNSLVIGAILIVGGHGLIAWGTQYLSAGIASLLNSTIPLWVVLFMFFIFHNKITNSAKIGLALGFGGSLKEVVNVLRGYEMEDDPYIELLDPERKEKIRLTNTGRAHCGEFGL